MNNEIRDIRSRGWLWIQNEIIDQYGPKIGPYGLAVYVYLARRVSNDGQRCFPSYQTIAEAIGTSRREVIRMIKQLTELQLIKIETRTAKNGDQDSNFYYLVDLPEGGGDSQSLGVVTHSHQGGDSQSPYQYPFNKTQFNNMASHVSFLKKLLKENPKLASCLETNGNPDCSSCQGIGVFFIPENGTGRWLACECAEAEAKK